MVQKLWIRDVGEACDHLHSCLQLATLNGALENATFAA